jgi:gluconate 2-dehydrogenase gamma chain
MQSSDQPKGPTRRQFVAAGALGSASLAIGCKQGERGNREFLNREQERTLGVLCDQIIPADDYPSATQAGVLDYIDRQLARAYRRHRDAYQQGLEAVGAMSRKRYGRPSDALSPGNQLTLAQLVEKEEKNFFALVREHTMEGYYGSPRHGGNHDAVSWRMLGLTEPPLLGRAQYDLKNGGRS